MKNGEQSAFPLEHSTGEGVKRNGLTKREYLAAMAMQGMIANAPNGNLSNCKQGVTLAISWADELLTQLEK